MLKSDFPNRPDLYGRSSELNCELIAFARYVEMYPDSADDLVALWEDLKAQVEASFPAPAGP